MRALLAANRWPRAVSPSAMPLLIGVLLSAVSSAAAEPTPIPLERKGACPTGYYPSGAYCVPGRQARYALPKQGACPSGYYSRGPYCVATFLGRLAVPKLGTCPPGYSASGAYCVQHRASPSPGWR